MRTRLIAVFGIASALLTLTACRSSPEVAAYVGDIAITEQRVTEVHDSTAVELPDGTKAQPAVGREDVVETLVLDEVCKSRMAKQPFAPRDVTAQQVVEGSKVPATAEYAVIRARALGCIYAVPSSSATPNERELREVYDNAIAAGVIQPSQTYEQIAPQIAQDAQFGAAVGLRRELQKLVAESDVTVNPRYGELPFTLLSFQNGPALALPMGVANPVVEDRS